jgi:hypothetical protein
LALRISREELTAKLRKTVEIFDSASIEVLGLRLKAEAMLDCRV